MATSEEASALPPEEATPSELPELQEEIPVSPPGLVEEEVPESTRDAESAPPPPEPKKRGRPKGSKNKPKVVVIPVQAPPPEPQPKEGAVDPTLLEPPTPKPRARKPRATAASVEEPTVEEHMPITRHDLSNILSVHLAEIERQKRVQRQQLYADLVRGSMG